MKKRLIRGVAAPNFTYESISGESVDFHRKAGRRRSVLFFLRYAGCPICRLKLREIYLDYEKFNSAGLDVYVVLQSVPASAKEALAGSDLPIVIICDPGGKIFRLYGVAAGNIFQYIAPPVLIKAFRASRLGIRHGRKEGEEMQLPAVFILEEDGTIGYAYYGRNIGDVPDTGAILEAARA